MSLKAIQEARLHLPDGGRLSFPVEDPKGVDYVRILNADGSEEVYWDHNEWAEDPQGVMAAILGALTGHFSARGLATAGLLQTGTDGD